MTQIAALALAVSGGPLAAVAQKEKENETAIAGVANPASAPTANGRRFPGGSATSKRRRPGLLPVPNLDRDTAFDLSIGRSFFATPWVQAPASTTARDGLGPIFNAHSCLSCHPAGGRGALAHEDGEAPTALVLRLGEEPEPVYGGQLQTRGTGLGKAAAKGAPIAEGKLFLRFAGREVALDDGTKVELVRPEVRVEQLAYGPLAEGEPTSARLAPSLHGAGLLDAVDESAILARADPDDADGDGISGRPNRVVDLRTGEKRVGRFGHKALQPSVEQQVAAAFRDDMGITSELFRDESCTAAQESCRTAPSGRDPETNVEIPPRLLAAVADFTRYLAASASGDGDPAKVRRGEEVFAAAGCGACHVPSLETSSGAGAPPALAGQTIWPYTDLLLHDMGPDLADGRTEGEASGSEWRTAPLWGLGAVAVDERALLHDGRARTIVEAILWHGGEAEPARRRFERLPRDDREALVAFLETL